MVVVVVKSALEAESFGDGVDDGVVAIGEDVVGGRPSLFVGQLKPVVVSGGGEGWWSGVGVELLVALA